MSKDLINLSVEQVNNEDKDEYSYEKLMLLFKLDDANIFLTFFHVLIWIWNRVE